MTACACGICVAGQNIARIRVRCEGCGLMANWKCPRCGAWTCTSCDILKEPYPEGAAQEPTWCFFCATGLGDHTCMISSPMDP